MGHDCFQGFLATCRLKNGMAVRGQRNLQKAPNSSLVIHHQHPHPADCLIR